jgi:hypothetical protein
MKTLLLTLIFTTTSLFVSAQIDFKENRLYIKKFDVDDITDSVYESIYGYDSICKPLYEWTHKIRRAVWGCYYGPGLGYYLKLNCKQYTWQETIEMRLWWYFKWKEIID